MFSKSWQIGCGSNAAPKLSEIAGCRFHRLATLVASGVLGLVVAVDSQVPGQLLSNATISATEGGPQVAPPNAEDSFGFAVAILDDLDGDGICEMAVGAPHDVEGGAEGGAVWVVFPDEDGTVRRAQKISATQGGFTGTLTPSSYFGYSLSAVGDLDADGVTDLAVGAPYDDDGCEDTGAVWMLFLNPDGTVKGHQKISTTQGGFFPAPDCDGGVAYCFGAFGAAVCALGDLDGDGVVDLAVGEPKGYHDEDCGGFSDNGGAVWVLFLNPDGTVKGHQKLSTTQGGFTGSVGAYDAFGGGVGALGDLDGNGVADLVVGAPGDDQWADNGGAAWLLFLEGDGTVSSHQKLGAAFPAADDFFGSSFALLGDLDNDGTTELAVGAPGFGPNCPFPLDPDPYDLGAVWVLHLQADGATSCCDQLISSGFGGFTESLACNASFGTSLASGGNCSGAGVLTVGTPGQGATWSLDLDETAYVGGNWAIDGSDCGFGYWLKLSAGDAFGSAVTSLGDVDGDGTTDMAVGASRDDGDGFEDGAVWVLFLDEDGSVQGVQKINDLEGGFTGGLASVDRFGSSLARLQDLDGDGVDDLAVGAPFDDDGFCCDRGAVWILFLNPDGTVKAHSKISGTQGGFAGMLDPGDQFGSSLATLGDLDGDGVEDLAVGAPFDNDSSCCDRGAVWILFLNPNGTVKAHAEISGTTGGFTGTLDADDQFGSSVAALGDLDGDGVGDLAVGAPFDDDGALNTGAVWLLFMNPDGTVKSQQKISDTQGGLDTSPFELLGFFTLFGRSAAAAGDVDGDCIEDLFVGQPWFPVGTSNDGILWTLFLNSDGTVKDYRLITSVPLGCPKCSYLSDASIEFGTAVAGLGDLDGDGRNDVAVGTPLFESCASSAGADSGRVWVLFLDGAVCPWTDLGGALPGAFGDPALSGMGTLLGGSPGSLALTNAAPATFAILFVSLSSTPVPFKGGVLMPFPPLVQVPLVTSVLGELDLPFLWPAGVPGGTGIFFQVAIQDGAAVKNVALSNAVKATTPWPPFVNPANGHSYVLTPAPMDLTDARAFAASSGGYLASVNDAAEQAWIADNFQALVGAGLWCGLSDEITENEFLWDSGEPFGYSNWCFGNPDDAGPGEDYVNLNPICNGGGLAWNDNPEWVVLNGLVEIP